MTNYLFLKITFYFVCLCVCACMKVYVWRRAITLYCTQQSEDKLRELFSSSIMCVIVTFLTADTLTSWAILATSLLPVLIDYPWLKPYKKVRIFFKISFILLVGVPETHSMPEKVRGQFVWKGSLSSPLWPGNWTQVIKLGDRSLSLLSYLINDWPNLKLF